MGVCTSKTNTSRVTPKKSSYIVRSDSQVERSAVTTAKLARQRYSITSGLKRGRNHARMFRYGLSRSQLQSKYNELSMKATQRAHSAKDNQYILNSLTGYWLFDECSPKMMGVIVKHFCSKIIPKGQVIIKQGEVGETLYILERGQCRVIVDGILKAHTIREGEIFGELALFYECPRTATIVSNVPCRVWMIKHVELRESLAAFHESTVKKNLELLSKIPDFSDYVGSPQLKKLAEILNPMKFEDGDIIIQQGDPGNIFYIVEEGQCRVEVDGQLLSHRIKQGCFFGEAALVTDQPRTASIIADGPCVCVGLDRTSFVEVLGPFDLFRQRVQNSPTVKKVRSMSHVLPTHIDMSLLETKRILGVGGFGVVTLRADLSQNTLAPNLVAVKEIKKQLVVMHGMQRLVSREKDILQLIDSPFILKLFGTSRDTNSIYFVMEYLPGGDLFDLLDERGPFPEESVRFYAGCIISGLSAIHSHGIVYRDMKLENLVINDKGYLKIVDFGLAKRVPDRTYTICGSPRYSSPEVLTGRGYNCAADFWSVGVVLFECTFGCSPFTDDCSEIELLRKVTAGVYAYPSQPSVSITFQDLTNGFLTKHPSYRLGVGYGGFSVIYSHPWFEFINWEALKYMYETAPYIPSAIEDQQESHFECLQEDARVHYSLPPYDKSSDDELGWDLYF